MMDKKKRSHGIGAASVLIFMLSTGLICYYMYTNDAVPIFGGSLTLQSWTKNTSRICSNHIIESNDTYIVPNIVHYLWFTNVTGIKGKHGFNFVQYVSIQSVYKIQKPDKIFFHCDVIPTDIWWQKAWRDFPLSIVFHPSRSDIFGVKSQHIEHISDIIRLEILLEHGGIYLDCDVMILKPLDPLRNYPVTMGKEDAHPMLNAATILASPNSAFLWLWYNYYKTDFRPDQWVYNSGRVPFNISLKHPDLIHTELRSFSTPPGKNLNHMVHGYVDYSYFYTFHLTYFDKNYNENNIKKPHTTAAEILRWIYYGTKKPVR